MHTESYQICANFVKSYLDPEKTLKILDVGSYDVNGTYKELFNKEDWDYTGLDITEGPNVDIVSNKLYSYPVGDGTYDVIISGSTIEHVKDIYAFVKECSRILAEDGFICIIAPNSWTYHKHPEDYWRFYPAALSFLLEDIAGLKLIEANMEGPNTWAIAQKC
jgi:SAM-dependent methyltransferase